MPKFTLRIDCDNDAFGIPNMELADILIAISQKLNRWDNFGEIKENEPVRDTNGNRVGFWTYTP